jgi:predicted acylesterase/phospholipase RssA
MAENIPEESVPEESVPEESVPNKKIRHIVCSGGGAAGFNFYGALKNLAVHNIWNIENIESMYGTSVGSIIIIALALKYEWQTLDEYLIKRPWHHLFDISVESVLNIFTTKGIFKTKVIEGTFTPLFEGKDISINVTMKEFFEITRIDIHIYTVELNTFRIVDISHKTHPDWRVVDAVYCSCSLPLIFTPFQLDNDFFCDGGILVDHPIQFCIENGADVDEILSIQKYDSCESTFSCSKSIIDYITLLISKIHAKIINCPTNLVKHEILIPTKATTISTIYDAVNNETHRLELINQGIVLTDKVLQKWKSTAL